MADNRECPFCGGVDLAIADLVTQTPNQFHVSFLVKCENCGATGPIATDEKWAWELWNDREPENQDPRLMGWVGNDGLP